MTSYICGGTVFKAWPTLITKLVKNGEMIRDVTRESLEEQFTLNLDNVMVDIRDPTYENLPIGYPYNKHYINAYKKQFLCSENTHGFEYTYGERLRGWFKRDQIMDLIYKLKDNKYNRRCIAITYDPAIDILSDDMPCLVTTDFKVNKELLTLTAYFRSQDIMAYPANVYGLNELLKFVGKETNLDCGKITTVSSSLHCYERDWKDILKVIYPIEKAMLEFGMLRRRKNVLLEKYGGVA